MREIRTITIDIETLPAPEGFSVVAARKNSKVSARDLWLKTALSGDFGRILCLGFVEDRGGVEHARGVLGFDEAFGTVELDERGVLSDFWRMLEGFDVTSDRLVGHNIFAFDLPFIVKRSVINGVRPSVHLSSARYRNRPVFDTAMEWNRWQPGVFTSLATLTRALGIRSPKTGFDGSDVYEKWIGGEHREIRDYCLRDIIATRACYRRMEFLGDGGQPDDEPAGGLDGPLDFEPAITDDEDHRC